MACHSIYFVRLSQKNSEQKTVNDWTNMRSESTNRMESTTKLSILTYA